MKPLRPCNYINCNNLTRTSYCEGHSYIVEERKKEREKERYKKYNKYKRDKETQKFYDGREWRGIRQQFIRTNTLCKRCLDSKRITHADVVDHIIPIKVDWNKRLDINNLQSLCNKCHAIKTQEDKRKYGDK